MVRGSLTGRPRLLPSGLFYLNCQRSAKKTPQHLAEASKEIQPAKNSLEPSTARDTVQCVQEVGARFDGIIQRRKDGSNCECRKRLLSAKYARTVKGLNNGQRPNISDSTKLIYLDRGGTFFTRSQPDWNLVMVGYKHDAQLWLILWYCSGLVHISH